MRIRAYVVPPSYLPGGVTSAAQPTPGGVEIYVSAMLPPKARQSCIDALAGAFLRQRVAIP